jgi:acyl carrier protein
MDTPSFSAEPTSVRARMQQLLFALLQQCDANPFVSAEAIADDIDLTTIGMTSIDFLEFALTVEQEFGVAVLETIEPDELPLTPAAWQRHVCERSAS